MPLRWRSSTVVTHPYPWAFEAIKFTPGIVRPAVGAPYVLFLPDASVKAVRRRGRFVDVFATERKEFTDYLMGKISLHLEFPTDGAAERFAREFARTEDPATLDAAVQVDVDRSKSLVWTRRLVLRTSPFTVGIALAAILFSLIWIYVGPPSLAGIASATAGIALTAYLYLPEHLREHRREVVDHKRKWPRVCADKWARDAARHAEEFAAQLREMGVALEPEGSLAALDGHLRGLPPDAVFGQHAWGAAAFLGYAFLRRLGRRVNYEWTWWEDYGTPVLMFPDIEYFVAPFTTVLKVWKRKEPATLEETLAEHRETILRRHAFRFLPEFIALGFLDRGWADFDPLEAQVAADLEEAPGTMSRLGESAYRCRTLGFGPFEIRYVDMEVEEPDGTRFVPILAIPVPRARQAMRATIDTAPRREDVLPVRIEGAELVALGVQIANYLEVASRNPSWQGPAALQLAAIAHEGHVLTPRLRATRPEQSDGISPASVDDEGVPVAPYAVVLGQIAGVEEERDPFRDIPLWRIRVGVPNLDLDVLVRRDRCDGMPEVGHYLAAQVWLVADVALEGLAPGYIR